MVATLHDYDTAEEIREATPAELDESRDAARHDGGAGVIRVDGRRCYVAGDAPEPPALTPWSAVRVWWLGAGQAGAECTDDETIAALREYRRTGGMYLRVLADPHDFDADGDPRSGEGPNLTDAGPAVDEIDWTGFPEAEDDGEASEP